MDNINVKQINNMKEMRTYFVKYKDQSDFGCGEEVKVYESEVFVKTGLRHSGEKIAVMKVQETLLKEHEYMSRLVDVYEIEEDSSCDDCNQEWKLDDGTVLDQEDQDALNDAFGSYTNDDGVTLEERIKEIEENK
jgi:hypothetical protein